MNYLLCNMENGSQIDTIYTDFSKAFDRVYHELLSKKMLSIGCPPTFVKWLSSYLTGRIQKVRIGNHVSNDIFVLSGVPQGSHLGPLLFVVFINDLCSMFKDCIFSLYADDLKIYKRVESINDCIILQENFTVINDWCKANFMSLNILKCKCITYSRKLCRNKIIFDYGIDGTNLLRCTVMNDLGVLIDEKVNLNEYVDVITNKARKMLGFIKRQGKSFHDPYVIKALYCSLVRPILEYCSVVWMPFTKTQIDKVESIQKQFLLFALRNLHWNHPFELPKYEHRLQLLNMIPLSDRRVISSASFMYKLLNGQIDVPYLKDLIMENESIYHTRNRPPLIYNSHSTNYGMNEPLTRLVRLYNLYQYEFNDSSSVINLKSRIRQKLCL